MDFKDIKAVLDSTGVDVTVDRFIPIYRRKFGETHGTWAVECTEPSIAFVKVCKDKEEAERIARSLNALKMVRLTIAIMEQKTKEEAT